MTNVKTRFILFAVAVATVAGGASAQVKPYALAGSDTLEVVMKDTIKRLDGTLTYGTAVVLPGWSSSIAYLGGGSGTAESAVVADKQSIAAMSRNLKGLAGGSFVGLAAAVCMDPFTSLATKTTCTLGAAGDTGCATTFGAGSTCVNAALYCAATAAGTAVICTAATAATDCGSATACTGTLPPKRFAPNSYINVVGLDAAVLVEYSAPTQVKDLKRSNFVDTYGDVPDTTNKLIPNLWGTCSGTPTKRCAKNGIDTTSLNNIAGCPTASETCVADANASYNNAFQVILAGIDGSGTTRACSHPARLKAIADFSKAQGNKQLQHFYRRDDNSGTTDTFKDKVGVGNFCNGKASGVLATQRYCVTSGQITNTRCTAADVATTCAAFPSATCPQVFGYQSPETGAPTGLVSFNVANQDIDPIRFPCPDKKPGTLQTNCTNVWTSQLCTATDNPHDATTGSLACDPTLPYDGNAAVGPLNGCPCTQGFVVALAEGDNTGTLYDVTRTIGSRVASDTGSSIGYAGREAIRSGYASDAPTIGFSPQNDGHIRNDDYVLARRLFLAQAPNNADSVTLATGNETAIGGAGKLAQEAFLANFMTADSTTALVGSSGACNIQDIVAKAGFIGCLANCKSIPAVPNICAKTFPVAPSFPGQLVPGQGLLGGPWWDYGPATNFNAAVNNCAATSAIGAPVTGFVTVAASTGVCPTGLGTRPAGYACSTSRECQTGLTCADNGQLLGILVCQ
jgi:hypothetical protein